MQAIAAAEEATRLALQDQPGDSKLDARLLIVLRAAVRFWRVHGHLEVPVKSEMLEGQKTSLGGWLAQLRPPSTPAPPPGRQAPAADSGSSHLAGTSAVLVQNPA